MNYQKKPILWFTGLSGAGKTTIARELFNKLEKMKYKIYHLDGDEVRSLLPKKLGFSKEDRDKNIKMAINLAKQHQNRGFIVISSFITPYFHQRKWGRNKIDGFIEVFIDSPIFVCERRDPKGLYKKAREGNIAFFTGIDDPYEKPIDPEIHLQTDIFSVEKNVGKIIKYLVDKKLL